MKQRLYALVLVFFTLVKGSSQSINPSGTSEVCPSTNIVFTVTLPPVTDPNGITVNPLAGGTQVIVLPNNIQSNGSQTTFNFTGKFFDANMSQSFRINYSTSAGAQVYDVVFTKVKSMLHFDAALACANFPSFMNPVVAPPCQIVNAAISFPELKFFRNDESPHTCFGSITTYQYLLPVGWSIGSTVSTGSNWINGGASVTVTSDPLTTGVILIRPVNPCGATLQNTYFQKTVTIQRDVPTFSLSPSAVQIPCGDPLTQTFTVNQSVNAPSCTITYNWNLGTNNGWLYGGVDAPASISTSTNTLTLTKKSAYVLPSNVKVTPVLGATNQSELTATITWAATNYAIIGGQSSLCTGTSSTFSAYNVTPGSSYFWGTNTILPNYGAPVVQVNTPYASSTTITKIGDGVVDLVMSVNNLCGQNQNVTRSYITVGGYTGTSTISGYMLAYPPCYTPLCTPPPVSSPITTDGPYGTTVYTGAAYNDCYNMLNLYNSELSGGTWSLVTGSVFSWSSSGGTFLQFYPGGGSPNFVKFRLSQTTSCGTSYYDFNFYPTNYSAPRYYTVAPNPVKDRLMIAVNQELLTKNKIQRSSDQDIREVQIIDKTGLLLSRQAFPSLTRQASINIAKLKTGYYVARIYNGKEYTNISFIKE